jgi:cob(I)alamin adenosyltransferase
MAAIAGTTIIAVLAVVVVVLSYRVADRKSSIGQQDFSALEARVNELNGRLNGVQQDAQKALGQAQASLAAAKKAPKSQAQPRLAACLQQLQRQIDDLQAYLAYRTPPRRDRVSGACLRLLQPRFKG